MASSHGELDKKLQDSNATPMSLPLDFLKDITCDFSTESVLGQGGYGVVYKGVLRSGKIIAVKKLFEIRLKEKKFQNEVCYLMGIKHQNVVQFVGYCAESRWEAVETPSGSGKHVFAEIPKRLLCFEYVCNKSLEKHISDESYGLEWNMRYDIIKGICNGLHFLHEECHIVHLDLKPTNILMDSTMIPKIADFGLSRIFGEQQSRILTDNPEGTCGYMAPEYLTQGVVSKKADIFSLGVIVIEIITGHRDYPYFHQDSDDNTTTHLQQFTKKVLGRWTNKLMSTPNNISMESSTRQLRKCIAIALECVDPTMEKRPTTKDIIEMLNGVDKMKSHNKMQSDTLCKGQFLVMNPIRTLEQITRQNVTVTISGPREIEHPIDKPTKIEHPFIQTIRPKKICDLLMVSLDASQTKPWIVTGHDGGYIDIFDYEMQKSIGSYTGDGYRDATTIKFIERKQWFIAGSLSGYITVYTYERKVKKITSFRANDKYLFPIDSLAVHPTQPYVLSSCRGYIQLWDWEKNWQCKQTFEKRWCHADEYDLTFNPNDTNEFASANLSKVTIWNLDSLKSYYTLCGHLDKVNCLAFFTHVDNKRYLITGSNDKTAKIWDMQKRACVHTLDGFISPVIFVASPPHFSVLITGTRDGTIHLWSATNFRFKKVINIGSPEGVYGLPCLTGSGRVVMESESALFMIDILDEESADVPKKPMSSYFKMVYTGYAFALITVVCIPLICFVYQV